MAAQRVAGAMQCTHLRSIAGTRDRRFDPAYAESAMKLLLEHQRPAELPTALDNSCRMLALPSMALLGIALPEGRWIPIPHPGAQRDGHIESDKHAA